MKFWLLSTWPTLAVTVTVSPVSLSSATTFRSVNSLFVQGLSFIQYAVPTVSVGALFSGNISIQKIHKENLPERSLSKPLTSSNGLGATPWKVQFCTLERTDSCHSQVTASIYPWCIYTHQHAAQNWLKETIRDLHSTLKITHIELDINFQYSLNLQFFPLSKSLCIWTQTIIVT